MLKVVFIDDDETSLFAWQKLIPWKECGYEEAKVFSSSIDALEYVRNNPVDVIITDICMPGLDGLEIVDICSLEQPLIKIILVSAYRDFEYARKALRYKNVVDYITKPLKYDTIISTLGKYRKRNSSEEKTIRQKTSLCASQSTADRRPGCRAVKEMKALCENSKI